VAEFETVSVYVVDRVSVPLDPVIVIAYVPTGVSGAVEIVVADVQVGLHVCGVKVQVPSVGRPVQVNPTGSGDPDRRDAVTMGVADPPGATDPVEGFTETEKSNS